MGLLTKQQLSTTRERRIEKCPVPELNNGTGESYVYVRALTAGERDAWEESRIIRRGRKTETNAKYFRASLVALTVVDESGKPYYTEEEVADIDQMQSGIVDRIYTFARRLSGMGQEEEDFFIGASAASRAGASGTSSP